MNELVEPDFNILVDEANEATGPLVARIADLVEEYERGDFSHGWGEVVPSGVTQHFSNTALLALMRVYTYLNELIRVQYQRRIRDQRDSTAKETGT